MHTRFSNSSTPLTSACRAAESSANLGFTETFRGEPPILGLVHLGIQSFGYVSKQWAPRPKKGEIPRNSLSNFNAVRKKRVRSKKTNPFAQKKGSPLDYLIPWAPRRCLVSVLASGVRLPWLGRFVSELWMLIAWLNGRVFPPPSSMTTPVPTLHL